MGKGLAVLAASAMLLAASVSPRGIEVVRAQVLPSSSCSGVSNSVPMGGHYTGTWHSDGDYHFAVFNTDLDLKIVIDGTLDITVGPDGQVSGTAHGSVDAPIFHDGIHDVSSGTGTISGLLHGVLTPTSSLLVLSAPVIAMQWGTFIAGGVTVPRSITMPDYQLPVSGNDCVSSHGTISEQNFPTQYVVADGAGGLTQAAGIGGATGTWNLTNDQTALFSQLSTQVDTFIANANTILAAGSQPVSLAAFDRTVVQPLRTLLTTIQQNPEVARCLLDRLGAWLTSVLPALYARAGALTASGDAGTLRQATDLVRLVRLLQTDCSASDNGALNAVATAQYNRLNRAIAGRQWADVATAARDVLLLTTDPSALQQHIAADFHTLVPGGLDAARVAYAMGDDADAASATSTLSPLLRPNAKRVAVHRKKPRKKKAKPSARPTARPTAAPTPRPTATPTPTATSRPPSLAEVLQSGVARLGARTTGGATPEFSWTAVPGATRYAVFLVGRDGQMILWSWSGSALSAQYGDTTIPNVPGSENDLWPLSLPTGGYTWSVLALDTSGKIVALSLRNPG
ncbi:MAG TPA: hypothetical protein VF221_21135 [Chloroflexota bacterium]